MSSLLTAHLDQIALTASSIASLPFPGPKPFTNALLSPHHDITALIRDTEAHERALFHLAPVAIPAKASEYVHSSTTTAAPRRAAGRQAKSRAVAAVLGGHLYAATRQDGTSRQRQKGEVDVGVLLEGAERLCNAYPIPDAPARIAALRHRYEQVTANLAHYEERVARNTQELQLMNRSSGCHDEQMQVEDEAAANQVPFTKEDLMREEEEIRELERKKRGLEERVEGMERDLGGLMR